MSIERESGWIKPEKKRTLAELQQLIAEKKAELQALEGEAAPLMEHARLEAIAKIRNIIRAYELQPDEIWERPAGRPRR